MGLNCLVQDDPTGARRICPTVASPDRPKVSQSASAVSPSPLHPIRAVVQHIVVYRELRKKHLCPGVVVCCEFNFCEFDERLKKVGSCES